MKRVILFLVLLALVGCSSTKETRRAARAERQLKRLTIKFPELAQKDTVKIPITTIVEREVLDTVVMKADTIFLEKENLKFRVITRVDSVYIHLESKERTIQDTASTVIDVIQTNKTLSGQDIDTTKKGFNWNALIIVLVLVIVGLLLINRALRK